MSNLGVIDADPSEPPSNEEVIRLANRLLSEFNIPTTIEHIDDICAALFVLLYENLFSDRLNDVIRQPVSKEDEIHNCQTVIDVLSTDIVRDSLSHIRGVDIVDGDITAISNLLDIFSYLLDYVANRIESDIATDNEDGKSLTSVDQETEFSTREKRTKSKQKQVGHKYSKEDKRFSTRSEKLTKHRADITKKYDRTSPVLNTNDNRSATSDGGHYLDPKCLALPPSPIRPDQSQSLLGQKTVDSTDLELQYGKNDDFLESFKLSHVPRVAWEDSPQLSARQEIKDDDLDTDKHPVVTGANDAAVPTMTDSSAAAAAAMSAAAATLNDIEAELSSRSDKIPSMSASMPSTRHAKNEDRDDIHLRSTVGPINYHMTQDTQSQRDPSRMKGLSSSYNELRHLVERTAAMTRVALQTSPISGPMRRDLDITDNRDEPRPSIPGDAARLAKELNAQGMRAGKPQSSPKRDSKKVAFSSSTIGISDRSARHRSPLEELKANEFSTDDSCVRRELSKEVNGGRGFHDDFDGFKSRYKSTSHKQPKRTKKGLDQSETFAKHLARSRQPEFGAAHMKLKTEDKAVKKKQDFLGKMYEEDLGEYSEDVHTLLDKYVKASLETEKELLKSYQDSKSLAMTDVKKNTNSSNVVYSKKPRLNKKAVTSKIYRGSPVRGVSSSNRPLKLESEEDLLPFLLDEFPYLHLSDHTWHELCRKGLQEIENMTRVYQETKRKKSRAQVQLEEAAQRHDLLSNIMRKEMEHTKRMRDLKDQKVQHVQLKNKVHEKRAQSARARRYYNEFQVRARSKQLKRRTKEEMVFRDLFKEAMNIQRERIKDIRQYATDKRKCQETRRQNEMESLEKFYQDQFQMLAEKLAQERRDTSIRDKAQQQMVEHMRRELRKKMESEIGNYQDQMFRDDDDAHFRQIDADQVKQQLHMARYAAQI